jgi:DNA-binding response OmpR family regulator
LADRRTCLIGKHETSDLKRILVVDDDEATVFGYTRYLSKSGFAVVSASDLTEGLENLAKGEFSAVVFDVRLPDGNSIDVIPKVRAEHATIKIFVISGLSDPATSQAAIASGADEYLVKPLAVDVICDRIALSLANDNGSR